MRSSIPCAVAVALLAGCGSVSPRGAAAEPTTVEVSSIIVDVTEVVYGGVSDRRAGEILFYHSAQDALSSCLDARGYTYPVPNFVDIYADMPDTQAASSLSGWLRPIGADLNVARAAELAKDVNEASADDPTPYPPPKSGEDAAGYDVALDDCSVEAESAQLPSFPTAAEEVGASLVGVTDDELNSPIMRELASDYASCMDSAGFADVPDPDTLVDFVNSSIEETSTIDEIAELEQRAVLADGACRSPVVAHLNETLSPAIEEFARNNPDDMEAARRAWSSYVRQASVYPEWSTG